MIEGVVRGDGDAVVALSVRGLGSAEFDFVIDTGFSDWLTLPEETVRSLGLPFREENDYYLADGSRVAVPVHVAEVMWMGRWRRAMVLVMEGSPLLGMSMLRGCRLQLDVVRDGRVRISPLD
jgi:clan AA aspartic protease